MLFNQAWSRQTRRTLSTRIYVAAKQLAVLCHVRVHYVFAWTLPTICMTRLCWQGVPTRIIRVFYYVRSEEAISGIQWMLEISGHGIFGSVMYADNVPHQQRRMYLRQAVNFAGLDFD